MHFLNGERIYIKPAVSGNATREEQLGNCLQQLEEIKSGQVFKLNFFVDITSDDDYNKFQQQVKEQVLHYYVEPVILGFLTQPPLTCKVIIEAFFYDSEKWQAEFFSKKESVAIKFCKEDTEVLIGTVQANSGHGCRKDAEDAFVALHHVLLDSKFPVSSIVRQWNYLEDILGMDDENQRYQEFNNVRSEFYGDSFNEVGYPAATGIGMKRGGVIIEFVAVKSAGNYTKAVDNPEQIAAHKYSKNVLVGNECVLKTTPKFERARFLDLFGNKQIFISGTAAITGEKTIGIDHPAEQTKVTIRNIQRLYSEEVLTKISKERLEPKYGHARVYVKCRKDFPVIRKTFKSFFGKLPVVYIIADICRDDLLVEIEGKVILE